MSDKIIGKVHTGSRLILFNNYNLSQNLKFLYIVGFLKIRSLYYDVGYFTYFIDLTLLRNVSFMWKQLRKDKSEGMQSRTH